MSTSISVKPRTLRWQCRFEAVVIIFLLKDRRRLVLVVRETPLSLIHLRNMVTVTEAGGVIMPPVPALYTRPQTVHEVVTQTAARVLDMFDIDVDELQRWGEDVGHRGLEAIDDINMIDLQELLRGSHC